MLCVNGAQPYSAGNEKGDMREGIPFMPPSVRTAGAVYIHGMASLIAVPSRGPNPVAKANCAPKPAAKSRWQNQPCPQASANPVGKVSRSPKPAAKSRWQSQPCPQASANPVGKASRSPKPAAKSHRQSLSRPSAGLLTALSEYGGNRPGAEISTALCYVKSFCFKVRMV